MKLLKMYMINTKTIIDNIIWKKYLNKGNTKEIKVLEDLIKEDKIIIYGFTLVEILKDIKEKLLKSFQQTINLKKIIVLLNPTKSIFLIL